MKTIRSIIAIELSGEMKTKLVRIINLLKQADEKVKPRWCVRKWMKSVKIFRRKEFFEVLLTKK